MRTQILSNALLSRCLLLTAASSIQASRLRAADPAAVDCGELGGGAVGGPGLGCGLHTARHRLHRGWVETEEEPEELRVSKCLAKIQTLLIVRVCVCVCVHYFQRF